jgi:Ca2+:H+ antiporter
VHAVLMLVLHGLAGTCIVVGTLRHREQEFPTYGAQAYLAVLIPMAALVLVLPNYTTGSPGPFYTPLQLGFVSAVCLALYAVFLFVQTVRHRDYFLPPGDDAPEEAHPAPPSWRIAALTFVLLLLALGAVVLLAKALAPFIQAGVAAIGAPVKLVGIIVAAIVLMPESAAAIRAARRNRLQNSINLALGSGVASIALTIPAVAAVATWLGQPLALGIEPDSTMLLALSFIMAMLTYGQGRTHLLAGFVHLVLFATYIFMVLAP